jgi:hypothetical protein
MAMRTQNLITAAAIALTMPLAACAGDVSGGYVASGYTTAGVEAAYTASYGEHATGYIAAHNDDGLLPEPPANARAGQCFAKVVVPGQQVYGPPSGPHLKWVQSPPPPGAVGPVWCQVWDAGYEPTVITTPERYGWIRVICDKDATVEKIGHLQHRLHDWGYYDGAYGGQYDAATAEAVRRFQSERHIEHGGYLSYKTMETLEAAPPVIAPPVIAPPPMTYAQGYAGPAFTGFAYGQQGFAPCGPAPCPAPIPQPVYAPPSPCSPAPCQAAWGQAGWGQAGWGQAGWGGAYQHARTYSIQTQGRF